VQICDDLGWFGMVWNDLEWLGMVWGWFGMVWGWFWDGLGMVWGWFGDGWDGELALTTQHSRAAKMLKQYSVNWLS
jgi:hypothetical protein